MDDHNGVGLDTPSSCLSILQWLEQWDTIWVPLCRRTVMR